MIIDYLYENWQLLDNKKIKELYNTINIQHKAIQLIALTGKYLIPQELDDGNTSLQWIPKRNLFVGKLIQANPVICFGLDVINFDLVLFNEGIDALSVFNLQNRSREEAFEWMKNQIGKFELDKNQLGNKMHYSIESNESSREKFFNPPDYSSTLEWCKYRTNANNILEFISEDYEFASEIRVWPHNFDTGVYVPLTFNDKGEIIKSIRIGLAIPDHLINEPYYYVNHFNNKDKLDYKHLRNFSFAGNWITNGWKGAVLRSTEIISQKTIEEQVNISITFFKEAIDETLKLINYKE